MNLFHLPHKKIQRISNIMEHGTDKIALVQNPSYCRFIRLCLRLYIAGQNRIGLQNAFSHCIQKIIIQHQYGTQIYIAVLVFIMLPNPLWHTAFPIVFQKDIIFQCPIIVHQQPVNTRDVEILLENMENIVHHAKFIAYFHFRIYRFTCFINLFKVVRR